MVNIIDHAINRMLTRKQELLPFYQNWEILEIKTRVFGVEP